MSIAFKKLRAIYLNRVKEIIPLRRIRKDKTLILAGRDNIKWCLQNKLTYPNVSSSFCTDQISFVKYEVCMVEDDHGEAMGVGEAGASLHSLAPPPPSSPDSILTPPQVIMIVVLHLQK